MTETKKISFGFSKVVKKSNLILDKQAIEKSNRHELIKCVEGREIKLLEEKKKEQQLVIPLRENEKTPAALRSLRNRQAVLLGKEKLELPQRKSDKGDGVECERVCEDLELRAAREILSDVTTTDRSANNGDSFILPLVKPDDLPLDGAEESTINDYEAIPIEKFGMAMLRGMGWMDPPQEKEQIVESTTVPRPKGMGLGADKALKLKPLLVPPESNEVLEMKRKAFVRIAGGKHRDMYGQIEGFDDYAGRVVVRMAIGCYTEVFPVFMCQPVSKKEYSQYAKCINNTKYEQYKRMEDDKRTIKRELKIEEKSRTNDRLHEPDSDREKFDRLTERQSHDLNARDPKRSKESQKCRSPVLVESSSDSSVPSPPHKHKIKARLKKNGEHSSKGTKVEKSRSKRSHDKHSSDSSSDERHRKHQKKKKTKKSKKERCHSRSRRP